MRTHALLAEFRRCRKFAPVFQHRGAWVLAKRPMTDYNTAAQEASDSTVRPTYVPLGVDSEGCHHLYRTTDETIHVVGRDRGREHVEEIDGRPVDEWMTFVDRRRGWERRDYGLGLAEFAARALGIEA